MSEEKEFTELLYVYYRSWFKINDIYRVWSRRHEIQDTTLFTLYVINKSSPYCTQNEIRDKLSLPKQTVSLILSGLEKKGYILRELNPKDRRNKIVRFTDKGSQYASSILEKLKLAEVEAFGNMSPEQRRIMVENLCLLSNLLDKSLSK
ncbi:MarR family winged helix-turn-helix transcriptional regulator [Clostridium kluyveri]|uniref:MarR family transcriptional regulator n=1 Tax=Clostridium kluyveri TaxID=1534 RepID=A0A1L5F6A6_CLOKL|nr:MarR family transcriptional regulator [Clostridium kluyveri]APM38512.1 MarR family transcriptional regulator [Clostridium kluyveri]UZQ50810.1 MarR family transcriptional regulator [Clostridium kluyveri]